MKALLFKGCCRSRYYGARAANGVIVVKTKRGTVGKINVSYDGYFGIQKATYLPDFVNAAEYMTMANIAQKNIGGDKLYDGELIKIQLPVPILINIRIQTGQISYLAQDMYKTIQWPFRVVVVWHVSL